MGSTPTLGTLTNETDLCSISICRVRLSARTLDFHSGKTGSIPVRGTSKNVIDALSYNGNTADFGSANRGSIPWRAIVVLMRSNDRNAHLHLLQGDFLVNVCTRISLINKGKW